MKEQKVNLRINNVPVAASVDGHQLSVENRTGVADLLFFQVNPGSIDGANAEAIATGRVRLSVTQLKGLRDAIDDAIAKYEQSSENS